MTSLPETLSLVTEPSSYVTVRALYDFVGEPNFNELSFKKHQTLIIEGEELAEGWYMAELDGKKGLVPCSYVKADDGSFENQETSVPTTPIRPNPTHSNRNSLFTLNGISKLNWYLSNEVDKFILGLTETPQVDEEGEVNSSIVVDEKSELREDDATNGDEGGDEDKSEQGSNESIFIEDGPYWVLNTPMPSIIVHDPINKIDPTTNHEFTTFSLTSSYEDGNETKVERRFTQFTWLHDRLSARYSGLVLPPLPDKQFTGRFTEDFIERRRRHLQRYMTRLARHPAIRTTNLFNHFLKCDNEQEWNDFDQKFILASAHPVNTAGGKSFFQKVYHPEFNVDEDGEEDLVAKFMGNWKMMEKLVPSCANAMVGVRDHTNEAGQQYRKLSQSLTRLITGNAHERSQVVNEELTWCFREKCDDCMKLTKAIQFMAESMVDIADTYDLYTTRKFSEDIDLLKEYVTAGTQCQTISDMHGAALAQAQRLNNTENENENKPEEEEEDPLKEVDAEQVRSRCDTVFNVALAELNRVHDEKVQDFHTLSIEFLEGQIEFHEQVLANLQLARSTLLDPTYSDHLLTPRTLPQIPTHRPAPTRPSSVSSMVGEVVDNVGSFLKSKARSTNLMRSSLLADWIGFGGQTETKQ